MDRIQQRFDELVAGIKLLPADGPVQPSIALKLQLYGLFRQATHGDVQGDKPGLFDPVGKVKYDAWSQNKGLSKADAMLRYVALAESFAREHGVEI